MINKKERRLQHIMLALVIIVPLLFGFFNAMIGVWWLRPVLYIGGIGLAIFLYSKEAFLFLAGYLFLLLLIVLVI